MPFPVAAAAAGGAGLLSFIGQERANKKNLQIAREQMAFQERMSNTSYQRAMEDMRIAGINPMLAIQQGGASTPGGASATMQDAISPAVSSAQHARRITQELRNMRATEQETKSRTGKISLENALLILQQKNVAENTRATEIGNTLLQYQVPGARNIANVESSKVGSGAALAGTIRRALFGSSGFVMPMRGTLPAMGRPPLRIGR